MLRIIGWTLASAFGLVLLIAISAYLYLAPSDDPVLAADPATERVIDTGRIVGARDAHETFVWRGIPFAAPPIGANRWRAPRPASAFAGVLQATSFAPMCPQQSGAAVAGDEDCLYLNVWAPSQSAESLPVMVWIHGGGNSIGSASTSIYHGARLAGEENLVVVSIQYRLGPLGWFRHPALAASAHSPADASGNYGTLDIIEALQWTQRNIAAFGGNPENITIFGESAGGFNVLSMVVSPLAQGLFHRAISQSGGLTLTSTASAENYRDAAEPGSRFSGREIVNEVLARSDAKSARLAQDAMSDAAIEALLRDLTPSELIGLYGSGFGLMLPNPDLFADGHVLPLDPIYTQFERGDGFHRVPIMLGTNRDETKLFTMMGDATTKLFGILPTGVIDQAAYDRDNAYSSDLWRARGVVELANRLVASGHRDVYAYRFDVDDWRHLGLVDLKPLLGAAHAMEIPFVFGNFIEPMRIVYPPSDQFDDLSDAMRAYWAAFARTGDPNDGNRTLPRWPQWRADRPETIVFDTSTDGGIRTERAVMTEAAIRARFLADRSFSSQASYCAAYQNLFSGPLFDADEYATLGAGGCEASPAD